MSIHEILIPLLTMVAVTATGGALVVRRRAAAQAMRLRMADAAQPLVAIGAAPGRGLTRSIERAATAVSMAEPSPKLREELARAGYHAENAAAVFLGIKTLLFLISAAGLTAVSLPLGYPLMLTILMVLAIAAGLSFVPNLVVKMKRRARCDDLRRHLPDALDLLEICVSSGMGLDAAWNSVSEEVRGVSSALADEMALTSLQLRLGSTRAVAMRTMADRTGVDEVSSLVAVLVQSERFGTSVSEALRTFAEAMRERRSQNAAEAAEKTAVKILFPMVLFIFPAIFVVAAGPAAIQIYRMLSGQL